ncbi:hypothetical protein [Reichenbachiella sp. MSK19-1]|uniref:hypothetical protein n=1 Tax=Reichenbachiella sp. MSK19-1 TaxID=1897631 RepID=UPI000EC8ED59|nr:hypothetical protein [Reichenbachiella sp. MSK19-1]RJE73993.1 hypothetical protein BGP76_12370 [Reichenbachiella sp. MSK19-1]
MKKKTSWLYVIYCFGVILILGCSSEGKKETRSSLILDMVHHNPGEPPYESAYVDPSVIKEMGYNGKVYFLFESPTLAINWESLDPDILPKGTPARKWVDEKAGMIHAMHAKCEAQGLSIYAMSDLMLFPKRLIEKYGIEEVFGDPKDSITQKLLRIQIDEIFSQFPKMDGLVVRIGETYLHDAPYHQGHIQDKSNAQKTIIPLMQLLREEVCVKRDKQLIFRSWRSFDVDADTYMAISDEVTPHHNLIMSVKHCEGDFHRSTPFSKVIGMGRHQQMIEVQCSREYEGKGAYPNYIANGVIEGFEEHRGMPKEQFNSIRQFAQTKPEMFAGVFTWSRGGGWDGPYIKNEMWADVNAWVMAQWAQKPDQKEEEVFKRYAVDRLGLEESEVKKFRKMCLLSADAVVRGRNSVEHDMNEWWTRDQGIGFPKSNQNPQRQQRNLNQKDESLEIWREIVELAKSINWPNDDMREHAIGSSLYGLHLYEIYRSVIHISDAEARLDRGALKKWINEYDLAWIKYGKLLDQYPSLASLYSKDYVRHIKDPADKRINELRGDM